MLGGIGAFGVAILAVVVGLLLLIPAFLSGGKTQAQKEQAAAQAAAQQQQQMGNNPVPGNITAAGGANVGSPSAAALAGQSYQMSGAATIDFDGSPHAYGPAGGIDPTTGQPIQPEDNLANAGHPGNWWGIETIGPDGQPTTNYPQGQPYVDPKTGYYVSVTSTNCATDANGVTYATNGAGSGPVNADTVPYVALGAGSGAHSGDYVLVTNNSTGQSTWAIVGDYSGTVHASDGQLEMSAAAATAVGVGYNSRGTTNNAGSITYTVYPGSAHKPGGG